VTIVHSVNRVGSGIEKVKILQRKENIDWDYDDGADVLYISIAKPQEALGMDVGEGIIVRYREDTGEVVGLTIIGFRERFLEAMRG